MVTGFFVLSFVLVTGFHVEKKQYSDSACCFYCSGNICEISDAKRFYFKGSKGTQTDFK